MLSFEISESFAAPLSPLFPTLTISSSFHGSLHVVSSLFSLESWLCCSFLDILLSQCDSCSALQGLLAGTLWGPFQFLCISFPFAFAKKINRKVSDTLPADLSLLVLLGYHLMHRIGLQNWLYFTYSPVLDDFTNLLNLS